MSRNDISAGNDRSSVNAPGAGNALWASRHLSLSTSSAQPDEAFDLWQASQQALMPLIAVEPPQRTRPLAFTGVNDICIGEDGVIFSAVSSDPTVINCREGGGHVALNLVLKGRVHIQQGRYEETATTESGFILMDTSRPSRSTCDAHASLHLFVPRPMAIAALGGEPFRNRPSQNPRQTPLGHLLRANLESLSRHGALLDPSTATKVMPLLSNLAVAYLTDLGRGVNACADTEVDDALFGAACRLIETRLGASDLAVDDIARALGFSRTTLYRLFARHGLSVAGYIRETRLTHSRHLLETSRLGIADIAEICAYGDLPAFSKAFRRRFGVSPRDWRAMAFDA